MDSIIASLRPDSTIVVLLDKTKHVMAYLYSPWADRQDIKLAMDKVRGDIDTHESKVPNKLQVLQSA